MLEQEQIDELQEQAEEFARDFANAHYEMGQAQNFMRGFCDIFGVDWKSGIQFEERIPKEGEAGGNRRIDGFLPGLLLIEMKSTDKDMEEARKQAMGYVQIIQNMSFPRNLVCQG
ncbi:type IIL restriction-modification enzyme MmeI [Azonexus sp.]|uniref:type IIL restriction-modification enzyme MmeI n=1 Tax=Azonexus sp. TaxID=1872668 RepID=UPI0039E319E3